MEVSGDNSLAGSHDSADHQEEIPQTPEGNEDEPAHESEHESDNEPPENSDAPEGEEEENSFKSECS